MAISDRIMVMSMAHIVQDGTPRGLYDQPNSRFVADFIGDANIVPVVLEGKQGGLASVHLGPLALTLTSSRYGRGPSRAFDPTTARYAEFLVGRLGGAHREGGPPRQPYGVLGDCGRTGKGAVRRLNGCDRAIDARV